MNWVKRLLSRRRIYNELSEEIQEHLAEKIEELLASGMSEEDAAHAAQREFGNATLIEEGSREVWRAPSIESLVADIRYGLRQLRRNPGFTIVVVLTLAFGIGANTAIFSVINALMLRTLTVREPRQLVAVGDPMRVHAWSDGTPRTDLFSYPLYAQVRDHNDVFSSMLASAHLDSLQIRIDGGAEKVRGRLVTGNYFQTLGVEPLFGRTFTGQEDRVPGSDPVVVISHSYWRTRFSGAPQVTGRTVRLNNYPFTIIGVAPPGFFGEVVGDQTDLWVPMMMEPQVLPGSDFLATPDTSTLLLIGRLRPGVTIPQARENVNAAVKAALTETLSAELSADDRSAMRTLKFDVPVSPGGRGLSSCGWNSQPHCSC